MLPNYLNNKIELGDYDPTVPVDIVKYKFLSMCGGNHYMLEKFHRTCGYLFSDTKERAYIVVQGNLVWEEMLMGVLRRIEARRSANGFCSFGRTKGIPKMFMNHPILLCSILKPARRKLSQTCCRVLSRLGQIAEGKSVVFRNKYEKGAEYILNSKVAIELPWNFPVAPDEIADIPCLDFRYQPFNGYEIEYLLEAEDSTALLNWVIEGVDKYQEFGLPI